jgi:4-amino-4-deoxy-L-arabinose transferase-like glycosyltransferase
LDPGEHGPQRKLAFFAVIFLLWAVIYLPGLFRPALLDDTDTVHAEAAREMVERGDWVTLYVDGVRYLEKAPVLYWSMAAGFKFIGVTEWTARLPIALGVLALLWTTFSLGCRLFGPRAGFLSALVLVTAFGPFICTRILIPDMMVGLWLTLSFDFFLRTLEEEEPSRLACWGLAIVTALNLLTKGLIGVVFPVATIGLFLLLTGNLKHLLKLRPVSSTFVFLAVAAPWHILAALANPAQGDARGFAWFYFINEHVLRYLGKRYPKDYYTVPLLAFWAMVPLWLAPWCAFLPQGWRRIPHRLAEIRRGLDPRRRANLVFGLWAGFIVAFFSFSTRQEYYLAPALPAFALLIGGWLSEEEAAAAADPLRRSGRLSSAVLVAIGAVAFLLAALLAFQGTVPPPGSDIADLLSRNPEGDPHFLGRVFELNSQALGALRLPVLLTGGALLVGTSLNWLFRRGGHPARGNWALAAMMVVVLQSAHQGMVIFEPVLSSKRLALAIQSAYRPGDVIVVNAEYEKASTINFYARVPVRVLNNRTGNLWYGSLFPDAPPVHVDHAWLAQQWKGPARVFLWTEKRNRERALLGIDPLPVWEFAASGGKLVLTNRPPEPPH